MTSVHEHAISAAAREMTLTLQLCDELDISTVPRLREQLAEAIDVGPRAVVVDLSRCGFLDAQALVPLLEAHRAARRHQVGFSLRGLSPQARRLLVLTGLHGVFDVQDDWFEPDHAGAARGAGPRG